ncbi:arginine--tRNA ligase [Sulfitobacter donghicola]|uniref:Arginine--tRNA ligase n=1 Tax=Sulfitobacter donghicola DSW-25 = KCTC 12864 = JCM 14565 TaxID=1300350 RepID=A0A073IGW6_9RHOB|nr:arginine--tRNA ligase [Sulfitobacter donghicola]KEJ89553.1 arginyl-tRNA synthetase [Sulfitobacter donghicola DSW-25 = KCTC 12864 = JCM 14565]KIN69384.1 Arginyl-tRNA synthetase [Sulfitobacter donghicola DSW-25 = KCTC 12864 = JCM 14565]
MNLFADIRTLVLSALDAMVAAGDLPSGLSTNNVTVEPPRDAGHGDMATNAAMVLAKPAGMKPRDIAEKLAALLAEDPRVTSAEVAGPGFLNIRLAAPVWQGVAKDVLERGTDYGRGDLGAGKSVNVEYVSANPTGPLHVGHTRGAVFGDALASLLAFAGWDVTREYVINDGGGQIDALARSVFLRYQEAHGQEVAFPDGTYPGDYLKPVGEKLKAQVGAEYLDQPESVWLDPIRNFATDEMMDLIRDDLALLGVKMDRFFSEKSLYNTGKIEACLQKLDDMGLIYNGTLEPPKGKLPDDYEAREQTLFKSTEFGDDQDRAIKKHDGAWTYFAPDIAYHYDKVERGYDALINVFGADHGGYVKRMKAAVHALSGGKVPLDIKLTQLVKLFKNGDEFKMSKRAGNFVTLRDLIDEVGSDVTRFVMLTRKNDAPLDFDFDKVMEQSRENPVFYVQYAHARVASVMRKAEAAGIDVSEDALKAADLSKLDHAAELALLRKVAEWPRLVETAARSNEPHRVAFYLYELAGDLHGFWNLGNAEVGLRFIQEDDPATSQAKIALARAVAIVIAAGLGILGVTPAEEMR